MIAKYADFTADNTYKVPDGEHYVILTNERASTPDDYNPGSYDYLDYIRYTVYDTKEAWQNQIELNIKAGKTDFKPVVVKPANVKTVVEIS